MCIPMEVQYSYGRAYTHTHKHTQRTSTHIPEGEACTDRANKTFNSKEIEREFLHLCGISKNVNSYFQ